MNTSSSPNNNQQGFVFQSTISHYGHHTDKHSNNNQESSIRNSTNQVREDLIEHLGLNFIIGSSASIVGKMISTPIQCLSVLGSASQHGYLNSCWMNIRMFGSVLFKFAPSQALALCLKDGFSELLSNRTIQFNTPQHVMMEERTRDDYLKYVGVQFMSGALSGALSHCILHPFEMAQLKYHHYLTNHRVVSQFKGPMDFALKTNGFLNLYKGFGMFSLHSIMYRAFLFGTFDSLKVLNPYQNSMDSSGILSTLHLAQSATCISTLFSIPFLNARKEMMNLYSNNQVVNTATCFKSLYNNQGHRGIFKGFISQSLLHRSSGTFILVCYDLFQQFLSNRSSIE